MNFHTLLNPQGTEVGSFPLTSNSFEEFKAQVVGTWTLSVYPRLPTGVPQTYRFSIADFDESQLITPLPTIVAPLDGSKVPPEFVMDWQWPEPEPDPATISQGYQVNYFGTGSGWRRTPPRSCRWRSEEKTGSRIKVQVPRGLLGLWALEP